MIKTWSIWHHQFSAENRKYFEDVGFRKPRDFVATFPEVDPSLLRVVKQMFHLDVDQRPGTAELLQDTIFDDLRHTVRDGPSDVKAAFVGLETAREVRANLPHGLCYGMVGVQQV